MVGRRAIVTGAAGMLGSQVLLDTPDGWEALATVRGGVLPIELGDDRPLLGGVDLAEPEDVRALVRWAGDFDAVIHCAAYTNVDGAESDEAAARRANADACEVLARACAEHGARLVVVSTDFVFDGSTGKPYTEEEPTCPLGAYGRTKLEGEQRALAAHPDDCVVARTQWLFGPRGKNFPGTMLALARAGRPLRVVDDHFGSPTSTQALAPALWDLARLDGASGIFHAACEGRASWFDLAAETFRLAGLEPDLAPCTAADFPRPAPVPAFSVLNCARLADLRGGPLPTWRDALAAHLESTL